MGPSTDPAESVYREMRTFVIFALATLAFAAAIESDDIVPETSSTEVVDDMEMVDAGYVAHGDAVSTLKFLQEKEGRSESACRQLADNTIKEISTSITNTQTMLDRLYKGERCHLEMRKEYDAAVRRYNTAKNNLKTAKRRLQDALNYQVDFGRYTFSGLNEGNCRMFWNDGSYRNAKANYHRRKSELQTATGAYNSAKKAKESTYRAHLDAVLRCRCRVKTEHSKAWTSANKNNSANAKAWKKAKHMLCVINDTPQNRCSTSGLKSFRKPSLASSVTGAKCSGSYKRSEFKCKIHSKSTTRAGVVRTPSAAGYTLTGGGMHQRLGRWDRNAQIEQFFPDGANFNCDTGFGPGSLNCYGVYCQKDGRAPQCTTRSVRMKNRSGTKVATLPAGYTMTGGGIFNHYRHHNKKAGFEDSRPHGNGWLGDMGFGPGDFTVYVRGCKGLTCKTVSAKRGDGSRVTCPKGYLVTGCGVTNHHRRYDKLSAFEHITPSATSCSCNMGFGRGSQTCYARCCK